jgi:hypothetical protein
VRFIKPPNKRRVTKRLCSRLRRLYGYSLMAVGGCALAAENRAERQPFMRMDFAAPLRFDLRSPLTRPPAAEVGNAY